MSDQFLQISAKLDSAQCYGFGEHEHKSFALDFNWKTLAMFSRDQPPTVNLVLHKFYPYFLPCQYSLFHIYCVPMFFYYDAFLFKMTVIKVQRLSKREAKRGPNIVLRFYS